MLVLWSLHRCTKIKVCVYWTGQLSRWSTFNASLAEIVLTSSAQWWQCRPNAKYVPLYSTSQHQDIPKTVIGSPCLSIQASFVSDLIKYTLHSEALQRAALVCKMTKFKLYRQIYFYIPVSKIFLSALELSMLLWFYLYKRNLVFFKERSVRFISL